jgi:biopolymer transport protein ExbD
MSAWLVRQEGSPSAVSVPSEAEVLLGLRNGNWLPTDEVKGPADTQYQSIESHPTFAEAAAEIEPPKAEPKDETHLDMNPLIDVCLVLLIFFILTITYASLERAIDVPALNNDQKGPSQVDWKDIKDHVFLVSAKMDGDKTVIRVASKEVPLDQVQAEMKRVIDSTGRKEMVLDSDQEVPWGIITAILDAAKGNGVRNILNNRRR